jgi:uncharacterized protein YjbJ (UPF0337 family)
MSGRECTSRPPHRALESDVHRNCMTPERFIVSLMDADEEMNMDKDRMKGAAKNTTGKMKEAAGKMTGDTKMQAEGKMDRASGKVQNAVGGAKDAMKK